MAKETGALVAISASFLPSPTKIQFLVSFRPYCLNIIFKKEYLSSKSEGCVFHAINFPFLSQIYLHAANPCAMTFSPSLFNNSACAFSISSWKPPEIKTGIYLFVSRFLKKSSTPSLYFALSKIVLKISFVSPYFLCIAMVSLTHSK